MKLKPGHIKLGIQLPKPNIHLKKEYTLCKAFVSCLAILKPTRQDFEHLNMIEMRLQNEISSPPFARADERPIHQYQLCLKKQILG